MNEYPESWDDWLLAQQQEAMQQLDEDEQWQEQWADG